MLALIFVAATLASAVLAAAMLRWTRARGILDIPNERSSHAHATPRGGGVSIVAVTIVAELAAWSMGWLSTRAAVALLAGGALTAAIGAWDDVRSISVRARLPVQFVAATIVVLVMPHRMPDGTAVGALVAVGAVVAIVWMTNLYNFMDGIDGIAGLQGAVAGVGGAAVLLLVGAPGLGAVLAAAGGAALGFLTCNWSPARIFMGDVGSSFLGFTFAALAWIGTAERGAAAAWMLLPLLPFMLDATTTLCRRAVRRAPVTQAHRDHIYQRAVIGGSSHASVALAYGGAAALLALFAAAGVRLAGPEAAAAALGAVAVTLIVYTVAATRLGAVVTREPRAR